jgi:hypothetical protein
MLPSDFKWQPRAKRKLAADKENDSANPIRDVSQPGVRNSVDTAGPTKKAKVAEGSLSDAERKPAAKRVHSPARARVIAVFLIAGEADVKGVVDGAEVVRRVPVVRVQLQERPSFVPGSKYIKLTEWEQSLVVALFQSARSLGCGVNQTVAGIRRVHAVFQHVAKASVQRWANNEKEPRAARGCKGGSGRPKVISTQCREKIKQMVRVLS